MNPPKRRTKRIPNHPENEDMIVHENEKPLLNLISRILADIFLKEMEEGDYKTEPKAPSWKRPHKAFSTPNRIIVK